jgi:hypothetical protein
MKFVSGDLNEGFIVDLVACRRLPRRIRSNFRMFSSAEGQRPTGLL